MRKRGTCLAVIDMFWVVGYLSALGNRMTLQIIPLNLRNLLNHRL